ncbi:MAG: alpha/beta hydrolase family esterase [Nitrospiraceae bacterium]
MNTLLFIIFRVMIVLSVALLVVGIFKPEWLRFRQKQPGRITIVAVAIGILMIGFTGAGTIQYAGKNNTEAVYRGKMLGEAVYAVDNNTLRCEPGTKPGHAGPSNDEKTSAGIRYMVKTPVNYNSSIAHPLLMVYAPGGRNRYESEDYMYLTQEGTAAGFIVAYADHRKMTPEAIEELAEIPGLIEKKWCIDKKRIFLTGHSDGGTVATGIAFINGTKHIPAAIAPSAVGIRGDDLQEQNCPNPLPVMVMHSSHDTLFPGYGKETIKWWAACNGCSTASPVQDADGCVTYRGCKNNVTTRYCEGTGTHREWPGNNKAIIDFFRSSQDVR